MGAWAQQWVRAWGRGLGDTGQEAHLQPGMDPAGHCATLAVACCAAPLNWWTLTWLQTSPASCSSGPASKAWSYETSALVFALAWAGWRGRAGVVTTTFPEGSFSFETEPPGASQLLT